MDPEADVELGGQQAQNGDQRNGTRGTIAATTNDDASESTIGMSNGERLPQQQQVLSASLAARAEDIYKHHNRFWRIIFWFGLPMDWTGHILPVDLRSEWRQHLVWAKNDGEKLLQTVTSRFQSNSIILSLITSTELGVLFSPSKVAEEVRQAMQDPSNYGLKFWTGIVLCNSILFSIMGLLSSFTAW
jgi:hypothetical protein